MDQLKDILKQAIKYRFWIAVGIAALLPIIAYAAGSGAIKQKAEEEKNKITAANTDVQQYTSGVVPNAAYKPAVEDKKVELVKDVNASWKKLYSQQAPLLTWPKSVEERFTTWGRKWPENEDASRVQLAIIEYVTAYRGYVDEVYKIFQPFDMDPNSTTIGVVSSPPVDMLLRPFPFDITNPPELGKVWAAQERLWTQRTLLEVIAEVNKSATDWNSATIKQINLLEVGNSVAQDQRSMAKGEALNEAPAIANPGAAAAPAAPTGTEASAMATASAPQASSLDSVYYIKNDSTQFKVLPFELSVLIEQDRLQNLLVSLENSPMAIQVMEFEMSKPATRVTRPVKGQNMNYGEYAANSMSMMTQGRTVFGGPMQMRSMTMAPAGGGPGMVDNKKGTNVRDIDRKKKRELMEKVATSATGHTIHDPFYNIVEVTVYGQARFYNPPPAEPVPTPSAAETTTAEGTPPAAEAPKAEGEAPKAEAGAPKAEGEAPKAEGEIPKAEAPKEAAPAPTPASAPAPAPNGEAPKAEPGGTTPG